MAGGSLPDIRTHMDPRLLAAIPTMHPISPPAADTGEYVLADSDQTFLIYKAGRGAIDFNLPAGKFSYAQRWINPRTGELLESHDSVAGAASQFKSPGNGMNVLWLVRQ